MLKSFALISVAAAAASLTPNAMAQCVAGGTGGAVPSAGTGDGTWPGALPTSPMIGSLTTVTPSGATVINSVKLNGLSHTWVGDMHIVLAEPGGAKHTIVHRVGSAGGSFGCAADASGNYVIVDAVGSNGCNGLNPMDCSSDPVTPGTYTQSFGDWPTGSAGIANTALEAIPVPTDALPHTWTLYIYDWAGGDVGALTSFELCFGSPTPPPPPGGGPVYNCVGTGAAGGYGTGTDGTWPTTMPTNPLISPLVVAVPAGATKVAAVKIYGWNHTWYDDTQIVLEDPAGNLYNVLQSNDGNFGGLCGDVVSGDFVFVDAVNGLDQCGNPAGGPPACSGSIPGATYLQTYGAWPSGSSGIANTNLNSISLAGANGTWNLHFYDWYTAVDNGSITGWELCFDAVAVTVGDCQILPTVTQTCQSTASFSGTPSASNSNVFTTTFGGLNAQVNGVVFYGTAGPINVPWSAQSNLCVKAPTVRLGGVAGASGSTGGVIGSCNGQYSFNMNLVLVGAAIPQGTSMAMQAWQRDPASVKTTQLSDSLNFVVGP